MFCSRYILQGHYALASRQLKLSLQALGRPLPASRLDLFSSLTWQALRQLLNRVFIGRWLSSKAGRLTTGEVKAEEVRDSARDAALVYHKLNQLHMTGEFYFWWNE